MIIQCRDYRYYENPIWYGDGWYVAFEYSETGELVVTKKGSPRACLASSGIPASLGEKLDVTERIFPGTEVLQRCKAWQIKLKAPPPIPTLFSAWFENAVGAEILEWWRWFDVATIASIIAGNKDDHLFQTAFYVANKPHDRPVDYVFNSAKSRLSAMTLNVRDGKFLVRKGER